MIDCVIGSNDAAQEAGGLYVSQWVNIAGCVFSNNSADEGGALLAVYDVYGLSMTSSAFIENSALTTGGVVVGSPSGARIIANAERLSVVA